MSTSTSAVYPVYAIVSVERLLRRAALDDILSTLRETVGTLGLTRVDGDRVESADVFDDLRTLSLLGGQRVVIVNDADAFIAAHRKVLEAYCAAPAPESTLILLCNAMVSNTRLYKTINKMGGFVRPKAPKGHDIATWIQDRARTTYGKRLGAPAAGTLRDHIGATLDALDSELAKLATYVGDRDEITSSDVAALTGRHREEKVFAIIDALDVGDVAGALRRWRQVLATDRAGPERALGGLAWAVRRQLDVSYRWRGGANVGSLARTMFTNPQVLQQRLQRVSLEQLASRQRDLLAADLDAKSGMAPIESAIDRFIVKHTVAIQASG